MRSVKRSLRTAFLIPIILLSLLFPILAVASNETLIYPLGEAILAAIDKGAEPTDAALLLLTRELKWYEQNMGRLTPAMQGRVQQARLKLSNNAVKKAAQRTGDSAGLFGAAGSWSPGRDMDMVYFGKKSEKAKMAIMGAFDEEAAAILNEGLRNDTILLALQKQGMPIPNVVSAETMCFGMFDLPDFGYGRLGDAYKRALEAKKANVDADTIMKMLMRDVEESMLSNFEAHIATTWQGDFYRGASGQQWFKENYLQNPQKLRFLEIDPETGQVVLKSRPLNSVAEEAVRRSGFAEFVRKPGTQFQFAKIASEYGMFLEHQHGGVSDTAKYYYRMWSVLDADILSDMSGEELMLAMLSKRIMANPAATGSILEAAGISAEELNDKLPKAMAKWTERQLLRETDELVKELTAMRFSPKTGSLVEQINTLKSSGRIKMDAMEIVSGLEKIKKVKPELAGKLLQSLESKFGGSDAGQILLKYIRIQLKLLADDTGELTGRILAMLRQMNHLSEEQYQAALRAKSMQDMPEGVAGQVKKARSEIMMIASAKMTTLEDSDDMLDVLLDAWRKARPDARITGRSPELLEFLKKLSTAPETELRAIGWTGEELRLPMGVRNKLQLSPEKMKALSEKLSARFAKNGLSMRQLQEQIYAVIFSPAYTKFGDPSMSVGAFDAVMGAAAAMFQTYMILNGPAMSEAEETIALGNAWVTAIPVVGDFAQGIITGSEGYWEGDKKKMAEAGLWVTLGITGMIPGGQIPAIVGSLMLAMKPVAEGIYEASQAQNLVQAWIESGKWGGGTKPALEGIYDRNGLLHRLNYEEILGTKGEVKYDSTRIKSLPFGELTIAQSVREYAQKYVLAGNKRADEFRTNLKTLFPDLTDTVLNDLSFAENKIAEKKSKLGMMFFKAYEREVRGAYNQTIAHLKKWAEDERRVAKDYDGEVKRLRAELAAIEKELKNASLLKHADDTVNSYAKIATNLFEQETLPLSKVRIYENYIATYKQIQAKLQAVTKLFAEASSKYVPSSWFLTGYPVFDKDMTDRFVALMTAERTRVEQQVVQLLKDLNQKDTHLDLRNECHKKAFDMVAANRYKIAHAQHLAEYYRALSGESSKWSDTFTAARNSYETVRDGLLKTAGPADVRMQAAFIDAFTQFVFSMAYIVATNDTDAYRQVADSYDAHLVALREHDKSDRLAGTESEAGKSLQQCLKIGMQLSIQLSNAEPESGTDIDAVVKLIKGTLPKETSWAWATSGGLTAKQKFGEKTVVTVASEGELTVRLMDERYTNKSLAETKVKIAPKAGPFRIQLRGPQEGEMGKSLAFGAEPTADSVVPKDIQYEWMVDDQAVGQGSWLSRSFSQARPVGIRVDAYRMVGGKRVVLGSARQTVMIRDIPKKDDTADKQREKEQLEKEKAAQDQAERERREAAQREQAEQERIASERESAREQKIREEKTKEPPACTYRYSEWGECSRATKRQARSVVGTEPFGCVEKGKPAIEQECTPPPTEAEKRQNFMNCLCWCTEGGYWYDPAYCAKDKLQGVCNYHTMAYSTHLCRPMAPRDPKCTADCYKTHYGKPAGSADLSQIEKDIRAENRKNMKPLKVTLSPDAKPIKAQYGSSVNLTANVEGGIPGYAYSWSGQGSAKDNTFTFINTRKPGSSAVSVTVTDSDGGSATASTSIQVEGIEVSIEKTSPAGTTLPVGGQASFRATVKGGGEVSYLWQPHPEVEFSPFEKSATTTATFRSPGSAGVWVDVLIKDGAAMRSAGRSNVITLQIANPQWTLEFSPANPRVGQPVKAKITPAGAGAGVNTGEMNFRWQLPANAKQTGTSKDDSEITFVLNDTKPANIACTVATKRKNENLGGAGKTIAAQGFGVKVSGPRGRQDVEIWKCETQLGGAPSCGMKKVPNQFAAGTEILFGASVEPMPEKPVSYSWTSSPAGCTIPSPFSRDIGMTCSSTGNYAVTLTAKSDGAVIGSASASVNVSISQDEIGRSRKARDAYEKLQKAKGLVAQGSLDAGIALANEVKGLDPKNAEAATLAGKWNGERQTVKDQISRLAAYLQQNKVADAEKELSGAQKLHPKYPPVVDAEKKLKLAKESQGKHTKEIEEKLKLAKDQVAQGKLDEGIAVLDGILKTDPKHAEAQSLSTRWKAEKEKVMSHLGTVQTLVSQNRPADAEKALQEARKLHPKYPPVLEAEKKLAAFRSKDAQVQKLLAEGYEFEKQKRYQDAVKKYQDAYALVPNAEIQKRIGGLQERIGKEQKIKQLVDEGYALEQKKNYQGAIDRYRQANAIEFNQKIEERIRGLEKQRAGQAELEKKGQQVQQLVNDGYKLEQQKNYAGALEKYRQAHAMEQSPKIAERIKVLEASIKQQQQASANAAQAKNLRAEGEMLQNQKQYAAAAAKYRESLKYQPDPALEQHIAKLEAVAKQQQQAAGNAAQAKNLRAEGEKLQNQKQYAAAAAKYRESLKYQPDPSLEQHIAKLEAAAKQQQQAAGNAAQAKNLRAEGEKLQNQKQYAAAAAKYRESLKYQTDPLLEQHIAKLESAAKQQQQAVSRPQQSPSSAPMNMSGTWRVNCGERDSNTVRVIQNGNTFQAFVEDDKYTGTINGNTYTGQWKDSKAGVTVDIRGTIVSANEMRQTHTVSTSSGQPIKASCVLRRM